MLKCLLLLFQYHKHLFVHIGSTATYNDPLLEVSDHSCFVSFYVTLRDVTMLYIYGHLCYHLVLFFFFLVQFAFIHSLCALLMGLS